MTDNGLIILDHCILISILQTRILSTEEKFTPEEVSFWSIPSQRKEPA